MDMEENFEATGMVGKKKPKATGDGGASGNIGSGAGMREREGSVDGSGVQQVASDAPRRSARVK